MNLSVLEISGGILVVSQFTCWATAAAAAGPASPRRRSPPWPNGSIFDFAELMDGRAHGRDGCLSRDDEVELVNDGPVTFLLDSRKAI